MIQRSKRLRAAAAAAAVAMVAASCGAFGEESEGSTDPAPKFIEEGALTVCTSLGYPPFEFTENGKPVGFDIDLANRVAQSLDLRMKVVNVDFDHIQSGQVLNNGRCDVAVAALTINGERARVLDFSSPYFNAKQAMVVREDSGISSLDELDGLDIGVQEGTTGQIYVTDHAPSDAEIIPYQDPPEIDDALSTGELDAAIYDNTVVDDVISRHSEFEVAAEFDTGEQYGMAVKKNSNVDLLRIINEVLAELRAGKGYDAIYNKWIGGSNQ